MNYKISFYVLLSAVIVTSMALWAYFIINYDKNKIDNNSIKTNFCAPISCGPSQVEHIKDQRLLKSYQINSDTLRNSNILKTVRKELYSLKENYDSIHGIRVSFTNDAPYKDYMELLKICQEKEPKYFIAEENDVYAIAKSKYQMREDSAIEASYKMQDAFKRTD